MMKSRNSAGRWLGMAALGFALGAGAAEPVRWDFAGKMTGWGNPFGLTLIQENDALLLDVFDPDSRIAARNLAIPCANFTKLRITYRAEEFAGPTSGELYYATDKFPEITDARRFPIGSLISDGKVHEITLNLGAWRDHGTVQMLRLDLVNQAPGLIHLMKLEFLEK